MSIDNLRRAFPRLSADAVVTSPQDDAYNCIAWAGGDTERVWWPTDFPTYGVHWPIEPTDNTITGFIEAFRSLGYEPCGDGSLEDGYEKVALYTNRDGNPLHMARQLPSGAWTSKMGQAEDMQHPTPDDLSGECYGKVARFMKRRASRA